MRDSFFKKKLGNKLDVVIIQGLVYVIKWYLQMMKR